MTLRKVIAATLFLAAFSARSEESAFDGIAAIGQAVAPIATTAIQERAAEKINQDSNQRAKNLVKIQSDVTKDQLDANASIAKLFATTGKEIIQNNQETNTNNLAMSLAMVDKVQQSNFQRQHEENLFALEMGMLQIRLAEKQREVANDLKASQLKYNLLSAGLGGFTTINSSTTMPPSPARGSTSGQRFTSSAATSQIPAKPSTFRQGYTSHRATQNFTPTHGGGTHE